MGDIKIIYAVVFTVFTVGAIFSGISGGDGLSSVDYINIFITRN